MLLLWVVCILLLFIYYRKITRFDYEVMINSFPGPRILPFFGNVFWLLTSQEKLFKNFRYLARKYSTYRFWLLHRPVINIGTAEDAEEFFSTYKNISKDEIYLALTPWLGTGLLTNGGDEKWKKRRKMITPAFHFSILQKFMCVISEQSEKLVEKLKHETDQNSKIDVFPVMSEFTLKVICETAMGITLQTENEKHKTYIDAVNDYCRLVIKVACSPWLHQSYYVLKKTDTGRRFRKAVIDLRSFADFVLKERELNYSNKEYNEMADTDLDDKEILSKKRLAFLDILLNEKSKGNIDDDGIKEEVNTFLFAGHDTTATAVSLTLLNLANNKDIQDKVVSELQEILGDRKVICFQDLHEMHYLEMCIKESLRMYPSVPVISRKTKEEMKAGKHTIPLNTNVLVHIYDIHHDPKYYPNPETYDPERFLPENIKNRHPFAFVPFSAGPRNCIGQKFAMIEMKTAIASILLNFQLEPILQNEDLKLVFNIVLKHNGNIFIKFKPRTM